MAHIGVHPCLIESSHSKSHNVMFLEWGNYNNPTVTQDGMFAVLQPRAVLRLYNTRTIQSAISSFLLDRMPRVSPAASISLIFLICKAQSIQTFASFSAKGRRAVQSATVASSISPISSTHPFKARSRSLVSCRPSSSAAASFVVLGLTFV